MKLRIALVAAVALLAPSCGGSAADESSTTSVAGSGDGATTSSAFAPAEGALVVYSGRNESFVDPVVDRFTAETGIEVAVRYAGTSELATALLEEGANSPADVFWAQDPAFIGGLANEGALTTLPQDLVAMVPERFRDGDGRWVGITGRSRVLVYNTDLVSQDELPDSVFDLTEPEWSRRFGIAPTNGSFVAFVTGMILAAGEEATRVWLEGVAANEPEIFDGNGPIVDAVVAGDLDAGLVNHYYLLQRIAELGEVPAENLFFPSGDPGGLVMATGAGVLASSDMAEAAEQFIAFLLAAESQAHFLSLFEYPLVDGVGTPEGQVALAELPTLDIDLTDTADTLEPALTLIAESGLS
ncbi:MAG: iron ABC transporter substrate-binding protein [Acidimicrobiia bacterium]|nr:iron ABC transporter substrate-binding protein [Acidimicrobiia bacterium]